MNHVVLFVDDEIKVLESIKRTLHRELYKVEIAVGAHEGLKAIEQCSPSVIVTDMRMPDMDGIEFLKEAQKVSPGSIYMVLSAYSDIEEVMITINQQHVWRYISKPWQNEELRLAIHNALEMYEHREIKKQLLASLEEKNYQLSELNTLLEDRICERTLQLQDKNEILQLLVEDTSVEKILTQICKVISKHLSVSPVFIDVPFLSKCFSDTNTPLPLDLKEVGDDAMRGHREIFTTTALAIPLIKSEYVLGVLLIQNPQRISSFKLADANGSFISAATLCLMQAKNLNESPELVGKIDKLLGDL